MFTRHRTVETKQSLFYGWWIVIAGSISQGYTSGAFWQGFGAFFDPIVEQFGWSRALTSAAVSIQRTESGAISPFIGYFIDRFGPRNVMLFGIVITGAGFIMLSRINSLWQFYVAFIVITFGLSFGTFLVVTTTVANWFVKNRSRALSITMAGSGLGGMLVPLIVWIIATSDWRTGLVVIGIGFWVMGIPVSLVMRRRPEDHGLLPDGANPDSSEVRGPVAGAKRAGRPTRTSLSAEARFTTKQALKTLTFWQMAAAMGASQLIISASIHHIPAITSFGMSRSTGGLVILGVSLFSVAGRLSSGFLGDNLDKRKVIAAAFFFQFVGTIIFAYSSNEWHLLGFVVFWGFGFGASIPTRFAMIADMFGRIHYGSIMGTMMTVSTVFSVFGPVFVGWMFDVRGSYREPFAIIALSVLLSIPLILTLRPPKSLQAGSTR